MNVLKVGTSGRWIRTALAADALGALVLMHGLGVHGAPAGSSGAFEPSIVASASADPHPTHHGPSPEPSSGHGSHGWIEICLAVLIVVGLLTMAVFHRTRRLINLPRPTQSSPQEESQRDRDPPALHALSIQRC